MLIGKRTLLALIISITLYAPGVLSGHSISAASQTSRGGAGQSDRARTVVVTFKDKRVVKAKLVGADAERIRLEYDGVQHSFNLDEIVSIEFGDGGDADRARVAGRDESAHAGAQADAAPNDFDAQVKAAESFYQLRRFDETLRFLMRALKLRPDSYDVVVALGNTNYDAERYEAAERWYAAALMKKPGDLGVRLDYGSTFLLRAQPDIDRALAEYRAVLARAPRNELALQNITSALVRKGDYAQAQAALARLEKYAPRNTAIPELREAVKALRANLKSKSF